MSQTEKITTLSFNQDASCIGVGSNDNCTIYRCDPFDEYFQMSGALSELQRGPGGGNDGASIIEMLFSTSLIAVVGNRKKRLLKIINTKRKSTICVMSFPSNILNVKMNRKRLVVVLLCQIFIYDIGCMKLLHTIETAPNPNGIVSLSYADESILAYPSNFTTNNNNTISIDVKNDIDDDNGNNREEEAVDSPNYKANNIISNADANNESDVSTSTDENNINKSNSNKQLNGSLTRKNRSRSGSKHVTNGSVIIYDALKLLPVNAIVAHKTELAAISLNKDGDLISTASTKGTIIRVFNTRSNKKIAEFRRGMAGTLIHCISFNIDSTLLCCSSNNQTIHIFKLSMSNNENINSNPFAYNGDMADENTSDGNELMRTISRSSSVFNNNSNSSMNASQEMSLSYDSSVDHSTTITTEDHRRSSTDESLINQLLANKRRTSSSSIASSLSGMIWNLSKNISKSLINNYLPQQITSILEPTRHFAFIRLSRNGSTEFKNPSKDGEDEVFHEYGTDHGNSNSGSDHDEESSKKDDGLYKSIVAFNRDSKYIMIGTNEGYFYIYNVPLSRGGECVLIKRYLLNDD